MRGSGGRGGGRSGPITPATLVLMGLLHISSVPFPFFFFFFSFLWMGLVGVDIRKSLSYGFLYFATSHIMSEAHTYHSVIPHSLDPFTQ